MTNTSSPIYCANHPGVETMLRCNKCGKPICAKCAIQTPTGYRCSECVRGQQKIFNTAQSLDYLTGFFTSLILGFIASILANLVSSIGFIGWFLIVIGAPSAGMLIAEAVRLVTRKHRSRPLFITVVVGVIVSALPMILINLLTFNLFPLIFQAIYLFIAAPVVFTRLSGIQLNR
jgi:hypothetical protein